MFNRQQLQQMQMAQMAWHRYFAILIKRCQQLRVPASMMDESLFIKVSL